MPTAPVCASTVRFRASMVMNDPSSRIRPNASRTGTPSGVTMFMMPGTFSKDMVLGFISRIMRANSNTRLLRGSITSCLPAVEYPWQGGPPVTQSTSPFFIPIASRMRAPVNLRTSPRKKCLTPGTERGCDAIQPVPAASGPPEQKPFLKSVFRYFSRRSWSRSSM